MWLCIFTCICQNSHLCVRSHKQVGVLRTSGIGHTRVATKSVATTLAACITLQVTETLQSWLYMYLLVLNMHVIQNIALLNLMIRDALSIGELLFLLLFFNGLLANIILTLCSKMQVNILGKTSIYMCSFLLFFQTANVIFIFSTITQFA